MFKWHWNTFVVTTLRKSQYSYIPDRECFPLCKFILFLILPSSYAPVNLPSSFCPQVEYKYDKEIMKGCVIPVVDDKLTLLALKNNEMASIVSLFNSSFWHSACFIELSNGPFRRINGLTLPSRWNTKRSMKRQRATTCLFRTLLRSCTPRLCALWPQR